MSLLMTMSTIMASVGCATMAASSSAMLCNRSMLGGSTSSSPTLNWGGGIAVRNLPQFYRNFPVMPLFKIFIFPEENSFLPFAVTRHTARVCCSHLSCMSFMWQDAFLFLCSQNVIHFWGQ